MVHTAQIWLGKVCTGTKTSATVFRCTVCVTPCRLPWQKATCLSWVPPPPQPPPRQLAPNRTQTAMVWKTCPWVVAIPAWMAIWALTHHPWTLQGLRNKSCGGWSRPSTRGRYFCEQLCDKDYRPKCCCHLQLPDASVAAATGRQAGNLLRCIMCCSPEEGVTGHHAWSSTGPRHGHVRGTRHSAGRAHGW